MFTEVDYIIHGEVAIICKQINLARHFFPSGRGTYLINCRFYGFMGTKPGTRYDAYIQLCTFVCTLIMARGGN